jgi:uncharacterized protein (DUF58 family)
MTLRPTAKLHVVSVLVALGAVGAIATARPGPALLVAPLATTTVAALAAARRVDIRASVTLDTERVLEGDEVRLVVDLESTTGVRDLEVGIVVPAGVRVRDGSQVLRTRLLAGERRSVDIRLSCARWGGYRLGETWVRVRSPLGLLAAEQPVASAERALRVLPRAESLRRLVRPTETIAIGGNQRTVQRGTGTEFADLRQFGPGDSLRQVNWRATARLGGLWVSERHPERSTDVVVFLDTFSDLMFVDAVRAADSLTTAYLRNRDRVGLVTFGGTVQWVRPGAGLRQSYLLLDALLRTRVFESVAAKTVDVLPPRVLPSKAMVIAVSPLDDERITRALTDLRARGMDVVVIELSPYASVPAASGETDRLARRLWRLRRSSLRARLRALGIPVVELDAGRTLAEVAEEVQAWPRRRPQPSR